MLAEEGAADGPGDLREQGRRHDNDFVDFRDIQGESPPIDAPLVARCSILPPVRRHCTERNIVAA